LRSVAGPRRGQEFVFSGPRVRIGRSRDNDLILPERDPAASSGHHAEVLLDSSGAWWIVDAGSANGTLLNDVAVTRHELKAGDRLTMGAEQFAVAFGPAIRLWMVASILLACAAIGFVAVSLTGRHRTRPAFEEVAASAARSVFLIAVEQNGQRSVVGTAFAVEGPGWLATNAHVADAVQQLVGSARKGTEKRRALAIQGDSYESRPVSVLRIHPDWRPGSIQDDVALMQIDPPSAATPLQLAEAAAIARLRRGTPVAAFGFPAVSTDPARPRPRLSVDVVGDIRGDYLEVGLGIAPGTSGSPVFDESGAVVAIVAGGDFVAGKGGTRRPSGSSVNWALGVSVLKELLSMKATATERD
jgi:S1-C subfamily serine protease